MRDRSGYALHPSPNFDRILMGSGRRLGELVEGWPTKDDAVGDYVSSTSLLESLQRIHTGYHGRNRVERNQTLTSSRNVEVLNTLSGVNKLEN